MSQSNVRYTANPKIDLSNPPFQDQIVAWDSGSAEFVLVPLRQPFTSRLVYQIHDGTTVSSDFEVGSTNVSSPSSGHFRMQPDAESDSFKNANFFTGGINDRINVNMTAGSAQANYFQRGGASTHIAGFIYNNTEPRSFFAFTGESNPAGYTGNPPGMLDQVEYLDWQYSPFIQKFSHTSSVAPGAPAPFTPDATYRWCQSNTSYDTYKFIIMAPQVEGEQDGMVYRAGNSAGFNTENQWFILTTKSSGSNQGMGEYLTCFSGGRLTFTDVDNPQSYVVFKFDESFRFNVDFPESGTPDTDYVAFTGLKSVVDKITGTPTADTKYFITVDPTNPDRYKGFHNGNRNDLVDSETLTRKVFFDSKGQVSWVGRRYEWGTNSGTQPYGTITRDNVIGGQVYSTGYLFYDNYSQWNYSAKLIWTSEEDYTLAYTARTGNSYGHLGISLNNANSLQYPFISERGPCLPFMFNDQGSGASIPDQQTTAHVSFSFTKKTTTGTP